MKTIIQLDPLKVEQIKAELINIFHNGSKNSFEVSTVLNNAHNIFLLIKRTDFSEQNPKLTATFLTTFYDLLDYFDVDNKELNEFLLSKFNTHLNLANQALRENAPEIGFSILRLSLCISNIYYRQQKYLEGIKAISKIKKLISIHISDIYKISTNPAFFGDMFFEEAKLLVRLNFFSKARPLFGDAIKKYEEWESSEKEKLKASKAKDIETERFRDFITYKISVTQAFLLYFRILQGKLNTVVREASIIERLLDYTNHNKLIYFVKMLRAKALRLSGFNNSQQLNKSIDIFKESLIFVNEINFGELNSTFKFNNYKRLYLMNLFQQGLTFLYLLYSTPKSVSNKQKNKQHFENESVAENLNEIINLIRETSTDKYWITRANLLEIYYLLVNKEFGKGFELALENTKIENKNIFVKIESLTALAEIGLSYLKFLKSVNQVTESRKTDEILEVIQECLNDCSELEIELNNAIDSDMSEMNFNPISKIFALCYLLQCDLCILEKKYDEAKDFWKKWLEVSNTVELSRWQELANTVERNLEDSENKLILDFTNGYSYKPAKEELEKWLYRKTKINFRSDNQRINALKISREQFYRWKDDYDK